MTLLTNPWLYGPTAVLAGIWFGYAWANDLLRLFGATIDFRVWDKDVYRLYEAACLWEEQKPSLPLGRKAKRRYDRIIKAIENDTIKPDYTSSLDAARTALDKSSGALRNVDPYLEIKKDELLKLAFALKERPKFIFPPERI